MAVHSRGQAPVGNVVSSSSSALCRQQMVDRLSYVTDLEPTTATALLELHAWDDEAAIEAYLLDPHGQAEAARGRSCSPNDTTSSGSGSSSGGGTCIVCFEEVVRRRVLLSCAHVTCDDCWKVLPPAMPLPASLSTACIGVKDNDCCLFGPPFC